jgi:hypothetical protein
MLVPLQRDTTPNMMSIGMERYYKNHPFGGCADLH